MTDPRKESTPPPGRRRKPKAGASRGLPSDASGVSRRPSSRAKGNDSGSESPATQPTGSRGKGSGGRPPTKTYNEQGNIDVLSSLQKVIHDLKTASPTNTTANPPTSSVSVNSNLAPNAPVFQPAATLLADVKHRKAASLGASGLSGTFNTFSPHLGAMIETAEDESEAAEDGEIQEHYYHQPAHQPRSQSQSFIAPRFAALAQQDQIDPAGTSGRPQLAPGFMFGARRRGTQSTPMGPPINEEDVSFQFPQPPPQQQYVTEMQEEAQRKLDAGEISGIMAEQVRSLLIFSHVFQLIF
jgi:protein SSD1